MKEQLAVNFTAKVMPQKPINQQMTLCKCYVMALGKNQNRTNISKEASDNALPSLYNIPVVGHLFVDEDGTYRMGGHDMTLEKDENGKYKFRFLTVPYGVVPQQDNVHYEEVEESDGSKKTYLVADVILWTGRYPELFDAIYSDDLYFAQSMEIGVTQSSLEDGYKNVEEYQYQALCMLGKSDDENKNIEPCFEESRIIPYEFSATEEWDKLFGEFKEELEKCYRKHEVEEGGIKTLNTETIKTLLAEFGLAEDVELSFEITDDMTEESLKGKLQEFVAAKEEKEYEEPVVVEEEVPVVEEPEEAEKETDEPKEPEDEEEKKQFALEKTYNEKCNELIRLLEAECDCTEEYHICYWFNDFDSEHVYCSCRKYSLDGEEELRFKIPYSVGEDGKMVLNMEAKEEVRLVWLTKEQEEQIAAGKSEYNALVEYKEMRIEQDRQAEFARVLDEFNDLGEIDDYKAVVKDALTFENADVLKEKLYAIRGKYAKPAAKKPITQVKIPVGFAAKTNNDDWEEFMNTYLPKKH